MAPATNDRPGVQEKKPELIQEPATEPKSPAPLGLDSVAQGTIGAMPSWDDVNAALALGGRPRAFIGAELSGDKFKDFLILPPGVSELVHFFVPNSPTALHSVLLTSSALTQSQAAQTVSNLISDHRPFDVVLSW